jgi:integrase
VFHGLQAVSGLKKGRTVAAEGQKVRPVADEHVDATLPCMTPPVRAMVQVQRLAGMRPGEVVIMRPCDIDRSRKVWLYRPDSHKTEHHEHERVVFLGPQAQEVLRPFLFAPFVQDETAIRLAAATESNDAAAKMLSDRLLEIGAGWRHPGAYLFSPREAAAEFRVRQRSARMSKVQPSQADRSKAKPRKQPQGHYRVDSYGQSVRRACIKAGVPHWHVHQLRHSAATEIRREAGLDAARAVLGHHSPSMTDVYAEVDANKAAEIMARIG